MSEKFAKKSKNSCFLSMSPAQSHASTFLPFNHSLINCQWLGRPYGASGLFCCFLSALF